MRGTSQLFQLFDENLIIDLDQVQYENERRTNNIGTLEKSIRKMGVTYPVATVTAACT